MKLINYKFIKKFTIVAAILSVLCYVCLLVLDVAFPPNLSRYQDTSVVITDRQGEWLRVYLSNDDKYRIKTSNSDLPDDYLRLLINYEDKAFYQHNGIDFSSVFRALVQNVSHNKVISGASTLSMQTARLLEPIPRSFRGKIVQSFRAWQLERRLTKSQILDYYATLAPVGGNREGIQAASRYYLNKPVKKLSLAESAWLVALTQSPTKLSKNFVLATLARNKVLKRAFDSKVITSNQYQQALLEKLTVNVKPFSFHAPHFTNYSRHSGKVKTTLDKRLQASMEKILASQLEIAHDKANFAGAILDNKSGEWRAYVGSADYFSLNRLGQVDMLSAWRSPGSALKPFITLFAFDWLKYHPSTTIDDTPLQQAYQPNNYDGLFKGRISLSIALQLSRNVPAVRLLSAIKPDYFSIALKKNGLTLRLPRGASPNLAMALGGVGVRGDELAKLYRVLANCSFMEHTMLASHLSCQYVTQILQSAKTIYFGKELVAFKTGTAYGWRDKWLFAYTKDYTIVLWGGRADGQFSESRSSAEQLLPVLQQVIGTLPNQPKLASNLTLVTNTLNQNLPPRLRHVGKRITDNKQISFVKDKSLRSDEIKVVSPLPDSQIDYKKDMHLNLRIEGGKPPYLYLLNNDIITQTAERQIELPNPSEGTYQLIVIDSAGNAAETLFRLNLRYFSEKTNRRAKWD